MPYLKSFDTLCDVVSYLLTEDDEFSDYNTQKWIQALRYSLYKDPNTTYFGTILQGMNITVINDLIPKKVDYKDPDPNAFRTPEFIRIYCGGKYNENAWCQMPTMAVDAARNLYVGEQFLQELGDEFINPTDYKEVIKTILLHESMHISELTFARGKGKEHQPWNIATDAYINMFLVKSGRKLPQNCIIPDKNGNLTIKAQQQDGSIKSYVYQCEGKTAEIIYKEIMKLYPTNPTLLPPSPPPPPPGPLQNGDPVYHGATGDYAVVIDASADPARIRAISKEEAMQRATAKRKGIAHI